MAAGVGHQLFWADAGGSVWGANPDGSNPQALVTGQNSPAGVAVDATHLYWSNAAEGDSTINRANLDGTSPRTIVPGQDAASGVTVGF
jgi:sugar lactone lactonase YvrE